MEPVLGAALNYLGARNANKTNIALARESMRFGRENMREQMGFQERMSNTSYQRAMQDMRAAGLNPILAANSGGASTPSGSSPGGQPGHVGNEFANAVSSAMDLRRSRAEIANLESQNKNLDAQNVEIQTRAQVNRQLAKKLIEEKFGLASETNRRGAREKYEVENIKGRTSLDKLEWYRRLLDSVGNLASPFVR